MEIKPITLRQASDFVNKNHRHHKATVGHKFSIGLFDGDRMTFAAEESGLRNQTRFCGYDKQFPNR